jgi:hypothetical protein
MLNLKAEDYGFEPNVTGFEEAVNLSYLDGKRDGIDNTAKNLIKLGYDDDFIKKVTGLDLEEIQKLRND